MAAQTIRMRPLEVDLPAHDLIRKPVPTFRDHALARTIPGDATLGRHRFVVIPGAAHLSFRGASASERTRNPGVTCAVLAALDSGPGPSGRPGMTVKAAC